MISTHAYVYIALVAILYGMTMKIADLLDEHGMRLFRGDRMIFGIIWGAFGALLVTHDVFVANAILAMILAFLIRLRLDYRNHALAGVIIIVAFLKFSTFAPIEFAIFFLTFSLFGMLKDYLGDVRKKQDLLFKINEIAPYNFIVSFLYSCITGNWAVFIAIFFSTIAYDLVKYGFFRMGYYKNL